MKKYWSLSLTLLILISCKPKDNKNAKNQVNFFDLKGFLTEQVALDLASIQSLEKSIGKRICHRRYQWIQGSRY
jgi:hypothetical protein